MYARITILFALLLLPATAVADDPAGEHLDDARSLYLGGHWEAADEAFEKAYQDIDEGTKAKAAAALEWGTLYWEMGYYEEAETRVRESLDLARDLGLDDATGELLSTLGHIKASRGELSSAEQTLDMCIQLTEELGDLVHGALCRMHRRTVRNMRGSDPGPEEEFRQDIDTLANADSALSVGTSLAKSSQLYRNTEDFERSAQLLEQAHEVYRDTGNVPAITRNQLRKAQLMQVRGKFDEARPLIEGLRQRFEEMNHRPMVVHALSLEAEDSIYRGEGQTGWERYQRALSIAKDMNNPPLIGRVHLAMCELNSAQSPEHCESASEIFASSEMPFLEIRARTALARTLQLRQDYEEARTTFRRAIDQLDEIADTDDGTYALSQALQYANLCQVEAHLESTGALTVCKRGLSRLENLDEDAQAQHANLFASAVHAAGRTAVQAESYGEAIDYFEDAASRYEDLKKPHHLVLAADILLRKGAIQAGIASKQDDAPKTLERGIELTVDLSPDDADDLVRTRISLLTQLTQHLMGSEDWSEAIEHLTTLSKEAEEADEYRSAAWAYSALANAYLQTERRDDAIEALEAGHPLAKEADDADLIEQFENNLQRLDN